MKKVRVNFDGGIYHVPENEAEDFLIMIRAAQDSESDPEAWSAAMDAIQYEFGRYLVGLIR